MKTTLICIIIALPFVSAYADRGSIPFVPNVEIFEPKQRALLAWNGEEEILILSTDLRSSKPTRVLEVIPLPSEPTVKKGDIAIFKKATDLLNRKLLSERASFGSRSAPSRGTAVAAGEVTFHQKIGAHDISVVQVNDGRKFVEWVNAYLMRSGVDTPVIPVKLRSTVNQYLQEGFKWFVFDVVALNETAKTNDAIQYRFTTGSLFYPLKISRSDSGQTSISLLILTPKMLKDFSGINIERVNLNHPPVQLSAREVRSLSKDCGELLHHRDAALRVWQIDGDLASFSKDLIAR